jgi:hypothetical protein
VPRRKLPQLTLTAYHEAGHAVVSFLLGDRVKQIAIAGDLEAEGHNVRGKPRKPSAAMIQHLVERNVMICFAGPISEGRASGRTMHAFRRQGKVYFPTGGMDDLDKSYGIVAKFNGGEEETDAHFLWLWLRTEAVLHGPENWYLVEKLAASLLEHRRLGERRLRGILQAARDETLRDPKVRRRLAREANAMSRQRRAGGRRAIAGMLRYRGQR